MTHDYTYHTSAGPLHVSVSDNKIVRTSYVDIKESRPLQEVPPLALSGTDFQIKVWQATLAIPAGTVVTYQALARAIGHPKAHRAVANALGANKIAYFIPCHRVIRTDGTLGGYYWGIDKKIALLRAEGYAI